MKTTFYLSIFAFLFMTTSLFAQDIPENEVPAPVMKAFKQAYPKAQDIEWEIDWDMYKAEFQIGFLGPDHEMWFDKSGKLIKHDEEISESQLPKPVLKSLKQAYKGYRISNPKKITKGDKVIYKVETKTLFEEWDVILQPDGKILEKVADY